jgi:hypothetical protein
MDTVRREIAEKRAHAALLEERTQNKDHQFNDPRHRDHLLAEIRRLRSEADQQEAQMAARAARRA